jgi:hypothetical protein
MMECVECVINGRSKVKAKSLKICSKKFKKKLTDAEPFTRGECLL